MITGPCPYDSMVNTTHPADYDFYQTLDDTPDGRIDSNFCVNFQLDDADRYFLDLLTIDTSRALFVRSRPDLALRPYDKYAVYPSYWLDDAVIDFSDTCSRERCSSVIVNYRFTDEVTDTTGERNFPIGGEAAYPEATQICFASERFNDQVLTEVTSALRIEVTGDAPRLTPYGQSVEGGYGEFSLVDSIVFTENQRIDTGYLGWAYEVIATQAPWAYQYMLPQVDSVVPSPSAFRYTEVTLRPNSPTVEQLELVFSQESQLALPLYTAIRGGLVAGSDTLRHALTITYSDDFFQDCLSITVERPVPPEVNLRFHNDLLSFANTGGCFALRRHARLTVAEDKELTYGEAGTGMLAARRDARIILERNATLRLATPFRLDHLLAGRLTETFVDLQPGSLLVFEPTADLHRGDYAGEAYLTIYMNGGDVDVTHLSAAERNLIRYVYPPEPERSATDPLLVYPNPALAQAALMFHWPSGFSGATDAVFLDLHGREVFQTQLDAEGTTGSLELPAGLVPGLYHLVLSCDGKTRNTSVIITE